MSTARNLFVALMLAAAPATQLAAQRVPEFIDETLRVGSHVRVSTISGKTYVGTVSSLSTDTIALNVQGAVGALPTAAIQRLQLRVAKRSGYAFGAILGGVLGGAGLYALEHSTEDKCGCTKKAPARIGAAIGGTAVGIGLGAVVGAAIHRDRWRDVVLPRP
jgi:hypothetical protein